MSLHLKQAVDPDHGKLQRAVSCRFSSSCIFRSPRGTLPRVFGRAAQQPGAEPHVLVVARQAADLAAARRQRFSVFILAYTTTGAGFISTGHRESLNCRT